MGVPERTPCAVVRLRTTVRYGGIGRTKRNNEREVREPAQKSSNRINKLRCRAHGAQIFFLLRFYKNVAAMRLFFIVSIS